MADSHAKHLPEPKTPMWLPALGATLFLIAGIWWAWTSTVTHESGSAEGKPVTVTQP